MVLNRVRINMQNKVVGTPIKTMEELLLVWHYDSFYKAVGLPGLVVVAGDSRISQGYSIISRDITKVSQLTDKCFLATSGMYADFIALRK